MPIRPPDTVDRRNVVLVTLDSLRADHCGYIDPKLELTPNLDELAEKGIAFENAVSPGPSTAESMPAIFGGDLMTTYISPQDLRTSDDHYELQEKNTRQQTIAEWFKRAGYSTAAFTTNPHTGSQTNFARGFDRFEDFPISRGKYTSKVVRNLPGEVNNFITWLRREGSIKPWTDFYPQILEWIDEASEPYFVWIFLLDTHTPYLVDSEYRSENWFEMYYYTMKRWRDNMDGRRWKDKAEAGWEDRVVDHSLSEKDGRKLHSLYCGTIRFVDEFFERIREDTRSTRPVFVVHSDHGEAFGEHGTYGHEHQLYEENIHVPLIVSGVGEAGRVEEPISLHDLDGVLRNAAREDAEGLTDRDDAYALSKTSNGQQFAVRGETWKYIANVRDLREIVHEEVYDLSDDGDETRNVAEDRPSLVECSRAALQHRFSHEHELIAIDDATGGTAAEGL